MNSRNPLRAFVALCAAAVLFAVSAPVSAALPTATVVDAKVMTQNLYIGADLSRILPPPAGPGESPAAVFQTALNSDIPGRLATFAAQVKAENPDLIGLQEVTQIVVFDSEGNVIEALSRDFLGILLGNLDNYAVSSFVVNADVTLPVGPGLFARVVDRDVIIHNTATTDVLNAESANFSTNFTVDLGIPIEFTRGYTSVDAVVGDSSFRFVNTHLEVQNAPCVKDFELVICQEVQAAELVEALDRELLPVVLLGDFNAEPGEPTYQTIVEGGYADTWNSDDLGFTCCQSELLNEPSNLTQRIDHIFYGTGNASLISATTDTVTAQTPISGLWYSDHAGVVADLRLLATDLCAVLTPTIEGGPGNDFIFGTDGDDVIFTYGGDDTIFGQSGDDIICSGDGDDIISAGDDFDRVDAGQGDDTVYTGDGDDLVYAGDGDDVVDVGDGADTLLAGPGDDDVTGGVDTDNLDLGSGDDVARSGDGDDRINGGPGHDTVDAGAGIDTCISAEISVSCEL